MIQTNSKLINDLEIKERVIPVIDKTITKYGKEALIKSLNTTLYTKERLIHRQMEIINGLKRKKDVAKAIKELKIIKKYQSSVDWIFEDNDNSQENEDRNKELQSIVFKNKSLNVKELITAKNFLKIWSPSFILVVYIVMYIYLKYKGMPIDIKNYLKGVYKQWKMMAGIAAMFITKSINFNSFLTNFMTNLYVVYQIYSVYNTTDSSIQHFKKCRDLRNRFRDIREVLNCCKRVVKSKLIHVDKTVIHQLKQLDTTFHPSKLRSLGYLALLKMDSIPFKHTLADILHYIGKIDCLISVTKLVHRYNYTLPRFDFESDKPYIDISAAWSPYYGNFQVTNNCNLGSTDPRTYVITGPNTSGKSTYIRNVMMATLFAQTIGVVCCQSLTVTPFYSLYSYIDIPNIARDHQSLFEAEVARCMEFCKIIESIPNNLFSFTIMDELFTGTNPLEGISGSYAVCEHLGSFKNSLLIVTTHFNELTKLEKEKPDQFKNKKFTVVKTDYGYYKPYTIENGVSDQNIAIELLLIKGYNPKIVYRALEKLEEIQQR